jgi:hypothetical protein
MILNKKKQNRAGQREFRRLIEKLYGGFPGLAVREDEVKKVLVTEDQINQLVHEGYLVKERYAEDGRTVYRYMLGANSLNLVANWRTEKLNKILVALTCWATQTGVTEGLHRIGWLTPFQFGIILFFFSLFWLLVLVMIHIQHS